MRLPELVARANQDPANGEVTPRLVRFLISSGVIPGPTGGRARAEYSEAHLRGIQRYFKLRRGGLSVEAIARIAAGRGEGDVAFALAPGVTLTVNQSRLGPDLDPRDLAGRVAKTIAMFLTREDADAGDDRHDGK